MNIKAVCIVAGCALSLNAMAGIRGVQMAADCHPWSVIGSLGYTWFNNAYSGGSGADPAAQSAIGDGQTPLGRFAIAAGFGSFNVFRLGAEVGVQSGNTMRLGIPQATLNVVGGLPVQVTVKPMLDLLATASWQPVERMPLSGIIKAGVAYRRMQVNDRVTFNDLSEAAFELQVGLGMPISDRATLSLVYQGVFDGNASYTVNAATFTGHISNIPSQNGLLLSLSYAV